MPQPRTRPNDDADLFSPAMPEFLVSPATKIEHHFARFHRKNPQVYQMLERRALDLWHARRPKRIGIRMLWEVMRYDAKLTTEGGEGFKLNDHCCPLYARLLIHHHPEWSGVIELRERTEVSALRSPRRQ